MYFYCNNVTFILIIQSMAFNILELRKVNLFVPVETLKDILSVFKTKIILWMKTIHYPNKMRSHLATIVPMAPFTPKINSKVEICSAL